MDAIPPLSHSETNPLTTEPPHRIVSYFLAAALICYWLVAFAGTHIPIPPGTIPRGGDKVLHLVGYAVLGALLMGLRASRGPFGWPSVLARWLVLAAYGAFDEVTQLFVRRRADVADWCADVIGAMIGLFVVALLVRVLSKRATNKLDQTPSSEA